MDDHNDKEQESIETITRQEAQQALPLLSRLAHSRGSIRQFLEENGIQIVPCNYFSAIPTLDEITNSFEFKETNPPFGNASIFKESALHATLTELMPYAHEFDPPPEGDEENPEGYFWTNTQFGYSDAMAYYAFIRHLKPRRVVEIGSGFSSLVALQALRENGTGELHCIEPFPRNVIKKHPGLTLHQMPAQEVRSTMLNSLLGDGDILFVDSTHTVKCGSDCVHIYLRLLPEIRSDIFVHVHDIFLPDAFPKHWLTDYHFYWTESYLLYAFLLDNPKTSVLFSSALNARLLPQEMTALMNGKAAIGGSSIWFRYLGRP